MYKDDGCHGSRVTEVLDVRSMTDFYPIEGEIVKYLKSAREAYDLSDGETFGLRMIDLGRFLCKDSTMQIPQQYQPFDEYEIMEMIEQTLQLAAESPEECTDCHQAVHGCFVCLRGMAHTNYYRELIDENLYSYIHEIVLIMDDIDPTIFNDDFVKLLAKLSDSQDSKCSEDIDVFSFACNICMSDLEMLYPSALDIIVNMTRIPIESEEIQRSVILAVNHTLNSKRSTRGKRQITKANNPGTRILLQLVMNKSLDIETCRQKGLFKFVCLHFSDYTNLMIMIGYFVQNYPEFAEELGIDWLDVASGLELLEGKEVTPEFSQEAADVCWATNQMINFIGTGEVEYALGVVVQLIKEYWDDGAFKFKKEMSLLYMTILECSGVLLEHLNNGGLEILEFLSDTDFGAEITPRLITLIQESHGLISSSGDSTLLQELEGVIEILITNLQEASCDPEIIQPLISLIE